MDIDSEHNANSLEDKKKVLMSTVRQILGFSKLAADLCRETPVANLRAVRRSAKNTKDPSPLSSTMITISTKYPISVDKAKARRYKVPNKFLAPINDAHQYGRQLCKIEAVSWWVENAESPSEDLRNLIRLLYSQHSKDVSDYYGINWAATNIVLGPVTFERRPVPTQTPLVEVAPAKRQELLVSMLCPDSIIRHSDLPQYQVEKFRELAMARIDSKMALAPQYRILLDCLNPKVRVAPVVPNASDRTMKMRHAICQSNFTIRGPIEFDSSSESKEMHDHLMSVCSAIHHRLQTGSPDLIPDAKIALSTTTILGVPLLEFLRENNSNNESIKLCKALAGYEVGMESKMYDIDFTPIPADVTSTTKQNAAGFTYKVYLGLETVYFRRGGMAGFFVHNGEVLCKIVTNYTDLSELRSVLKIVAVYIKWGFAETDTKNKRSIYNAVMARVSRNPWSLILCNKSEYSNLIRKLNTHPKAEHKVGILEIEPATTVHKPPPVAVVYKHPNSLIVPHGNQSLTLTAPERPIISDLVNTDEKFLMDFLTPIKLLERKLSYYLSISPLLIEYVESGIFNEDNNIITKYIARDQRKRVSYTARNLCQALLNEGVGSHAWNNTCFCFYYMFAGTPIVDAGMITPIMSFKWAQTLNIDFNFQEGIMHYSNSMYVLNNKPVGVEKENAIDTGFLMGEALAGYSLSQIVTPSLTYKTAKWLDSNSSKVKDGAEFKTFIGGTLFKATRNSSRKMALEKTMSTRTSIRRSWVTEAMTLKRKTYGNEGFNENPPPKRLRVAIPNPDSDSEEEEFNRSLVNE